MGASNRCGDVIKIIPSEPIRDIFSLSPILLRLTLLFHGAHLRRVLQNGGGDSFHPHRSAALTLPNYTSRRGGTFAAAQAATECHTR